VPPAAVLAAAALVLVLVLPFGSPGPAEDDDLRFYVQFVVDAPTAETVHVVGDFNAVFHSGRASTSTCS
jgi:1,4-alpha-glucan branching enzyme